MRLTEQQINIIKEVASDNYGQNSKVWLFGSRVDDKKRGGDIDLYIEAILPNKQEALDTKINTLIQLKKRLGDQKIDLVVHIEGEEYQPFELLAKETGVIL